MHTYLIKLTKALQSYQQVKAAYRIPEKEEERAPAFKNVNP
ncbi:hypothetical protein chiPu_0029094, partial [Chiloscyllium punctatum]|nr:hypothetical protein [Chiloscyllium punctatum]